MNECKPLVHGLFAAIDRLCDKHRVEKIETIGRAVQLVPMKATLEAPGSQRLKQKV